MTNEHLPRYRDKRLQQFVAGYRVRDFQSFERQLKKRLTILEVLPLDMVDKSVTLCKDTSGWCFHLEAVRRGHLSLE
jgi:hypothetical protein